MADFSSNTLVLDAILRELQLADDQNYRPLDGLTTISGDFAANRICFASNAALVKRQIIGILINAKSHRIRMALLEIRFRSIA